MTVRERITSSRGVATSLLETVLVIAIIAVLSTVALVSATDQLENSKLARANADAQMIGIGIHSFIQDNGFPPAFKSGSARGPNDEVFLVLETGGDDATADATLSWPADASVRDRIENQLVKNTPGGVGVHYPRFGDISFARFKGWNGPYLSSVPSSDPWGDKYLVTVQFLTPQGVKLVQNTLSIPAGGRVAAFVLSPGSNRKIETRFDQFGESFTAGGDDIVFRIR